MNKPYDFLVSDKQPFLYVEKALIRMKDGFLVSLNGKDGVKIISPSSHLILLMGTGTSITQEAMIFAAQHDMDIGIVRGGSNVHSYFKESRFQDPYRLVAQVKNQEKYKVEIAKELLKLRFVLLKTEKKYIEEVDMYSTIDELTLFEARWAKSIYRQYCFKYKVEGFKRDFEATDLVNSRLNILNNVLYSLCTSIALACHCSPSIGFIHGYSRRGGFSFDLADLIKTPTTVRFAFEYSKEKTIKQLMYGLMSELKANNNFYYKILIYICLMLGEEDYSHGKWEKLYDNFNIK